MFTTSRQLHSLTENSHSADARFNRIDGGKAIKYGFALCAVGDAGKKGSLDTFLNLKYFIQRVKLRLPAQKLLWPPEGPYGPR